jgi:CarD family transcriptional regulator, regulator of rRNA transcription
MIMFSSTVKEARMRLAIGDKIVYPSQGPCLIGPVVKKIIDDKPVMFYQLVVLNPCGGSLFVPVEKIEVVGIRPLLARSEIPKLLDQLKKPAKATDTWKQRAASDLKLFASGSAHDLAEIVESLTELSETKALSFTERKRLDRAKRLLVYEISEVMGETEEKAEERVDLALRARIKWPYEAVAGRSNRRARRAGVAL